MGILGSAADLFTAGTAADIQRKAQRKAGDIASAGYDKAAGFQQPIYDRANKISGDVANEYSAGGFNNPTYKPYDGGQFNPQDVYADPEYQAQLKSGTDALSGSAASKGMLFSGNTANDLTKYGSDLFAQRSNDLYDRFNTNRNFGANQSQQAYQSGVNANQTRFNEGQDLAQPLIGAANNLSNNATGKAEDLANVELGVGQTRANAYNQVSGDIGNIGDAGLEYAQQAFAPTGYNPMSKKNRTPAGATDLGTGQRVDAARNYA